MFSSNHLTKVFTTWLVIGSVMVGNIQAAEAPIFRYKSHTISGPITAPGSGSESGGTAPGGGSTNGAPTWSTGANLGSFNQGARVDVSVTASDPENDAITYTAGTANLPTGLALAGNRVHGTINPAAPTGLYTFTVAAKDAGNPPVDREFTLTVTAPTPPPEQPPVWQTATNLGNAIRGTYINKPVLATDPNGDAVTYTSTGAGLPSGLYFYGGNWNTVAGNLSASAPLGPYTVTVNASDGKNPSQPRTFTIHVVDNNPPVWQTADDLGSYYRSESVNVTLAATDPDGDPITYTNNGGSLPPGLTLTGNVISGTISPSSGYGTWTVYLSAGDGSVNVDRAFSISVQYMATFRWATAPDLGTWTQGQTTANVLHVSAWNSNDQLAPITWVSGELPTGTWFANGAINGAIDANAEAKTYTFTARATDVDGTTTMDRTFSMRVVPAP